MKQNCIQSIQTEYNQWAILNYEQEWQQSLINKISTHKWFTSIIYKDYSVIQKWFQRSIINKLKPKSVDKLTFIHVC